ncbi:BcpO-related WXXGXW repeat protein [Chlorobium sp. BLA1]|uniref:YXWGXW repeat-containing protein n=1 Tax=Candidatus Chlorobium masyuteum TaxID=2716876 RepID=UPI001420070D|nr:YXWGXW repeat-containing protein [Candidatus Chlorobium masyuteum]NHQ60363.1 BcpO-related WXXGXW repeat protein [Candidatus Chlorobium masyuteum]NTU44065.1 BcpO-related WXXGXW repeat protein [Chlorobiaceae bacterium]
MKKTIWLAAGITGMLLGNPSTAVQAAVHPQLSIVIDSRPNFITLRNRGLSVSLGSPYDIIFYGQRYYINQNGTWYRSSSYRGPWSYIRSSNLPYQIRRYSIDDIRRFRDTENRRREYSQRRTLRQQQTDENNRRVLEQKRSDENTQRTLDQQRSDENNRRILEQQRSDENNRRMLQQQRNDQQRN